jgi:hypothetical protein
MTDYLGDPGPVDEISHGSRPARPGRARHQTSVSPGAKLTALTTALAVVLTGGVVTAAWRSFQSHNAPERLVPSTAFAVGTLDLSMRGQDGALASFADHFPGSPTHHGDGSAVDRLLRAVFRGSSDPHVDYDKDIKPWLGDHVTLAGWTDKAGKPQMEGLLESTDDSAARRELSKLMKNGDGAFGFSDGYAVLGNNDAAVHAAIDAAHHSSLADNSSYVADIDALPGDPALTAWVDGPAALKAIESSMSPGEAKMFERMGPMAAFGSASSTFAGRMALGVRVDDRYIEVDSRSSGGRAQHQASTTDLRTLPATTIAAFELGDPSALVTGATTAMKFFGGFAGSAEVSCAASVDVLPPASAVPLTVPHRKRVLRELAQKRRDLRRGKGNGCVSEHFTPPDPLKQIEQASGLQLPGDAKAVLGDSVLASYGGLTMQGMPKVAVRTHPADLSAARSVLDNVQTRLGVTSTFPLAVETSGDDFLLGTSGDYLHDVEQTGSLGEQAQVQLALGDLPATVGAAGYVDLSKILPLLGSVPRDVQTLKAIGFWTSLDGSVQTSQLRIVVG